MKPLTRDVIRMISQPSQSTSVASSSPTNREYKTKLISAVIFMLASLQDSSHNRSCNSRWPFKVNSPNVIWGVRVFWAKDPFSDQQWDHPGLFWVGPRVVQLCQGMWFDYTAVSWNRVFRDRNRFHVQHPATDKWAINIQITHPLLSSSRLHRQQVTLLQVVGVVRPGIEPILPIFCKLFYYKDLHEVKWINNFEDSCFFCGHWWTKDLLKHNHRSKKQHR